MYMYLYIVSFQRNNSPSVVYLWSHWGMLSVKAVYKLILILKIINNPSCDQTHCYVTHKNNNINCDWFDFWCLMPLSAIFQLYHGDVPVMVWWKKPEYPERTTDHGQATDKLYHLRMRVECTLFSSPDPKGHVRYCHHLSSVVNFSYFNLLLWNNWTKLNQTWQKASI